MGMSSAQRDPITTAGFARGARRCVGLLLLTFGILSTAPRGALADTQFFRIGTGAVDSPSFAVAGIVAAGLSSPPGARPCERGGSCGVPNLIALAQAVGSPTEAVDLLEQRQLDAALVPASEAYRAQAGASPAGKAGAKAEPAKTILKPREGLRVIATLYIEALHVIVRNGTRFETVDDLKRRTVVAATDDPTAAPFLQVAIGQLGL
ncbi:MAG: hypothetical protein JO021_08275, partial [Alphaproteobacteria bacterium]|nr:hypothetical protein [Alphaproteobacteria bacterium]